MQVWLASLWLRWGEDDWVWSMSPKLSRVISFWGAILSQPLLPQTLFLTFASRLRFQVLCSHPTGLILLSHWGMLKHSPWGQYIGVNEKRIKQWADSCRLQDLFSLWCLLWLMHGTPISTSERRDTYTAKQDFFSQLPGATQHKPVVKVIGDLGERMPKRNQKNKTNSKLSNCKNWGGFAVVFSWNLEGFLTK